MYVLLRNMYRKYRGHIFRTFLTIFGYHYSLLPKNTKGGSQGPLHNFIHFPLHFAVYFIQNVAQLKPPQNLWLIQKVKKLP